MNRDDLGKLLVTTADDVAAMEWQNQPGLPGVQHKVLWQSGDVTVGLMKVEAGAVNPEHTHHAAHHHILMLDGECSMVGRHVGPGAYVYIPPMVPHAVTDVGADGCTFFYTYRPLETAAAQGSPLDAEHGQPV